MAPYGNFIYVMQLMRKEIIQSDPVIKRSPNCRLSCLYFMFWKQYQPNIFLLILCFTICFICIYVNYLSDHIVLIGKRSLYIPWHSSLGSVVVFSYFFNKVCLCMCMDRVIFWREFMWSGLNVHDTLWKARIKYHYVCWGSGFTSFTFQWLSFRC